MYQSGREMLRSSAFTRAAPVTRSRNFGVDARRVQSIRVRAAVVPFYAYQGSVPLKPKLGNPAGG
ncbi:hypothetical protein BN961_03906 [Afipia felis]|uniref:Uncharacterized protein n=1 Tax=Afipia felis TaxID=1035 RepID=A0A090MT27_AFIFE|nr:hypothetical protein BN961_03906 [Afipia felis]